MYLVGEITKSNYIKPMLREKGFDAVVYQGLNYTRHDTLLGKMGKIGHYIDYKLKPIKSFFTKKPAFLYDYRLYYKEFVTKRDYENDVIPQLFTQFVTILHVVGQMVSSIGILSLSISKALHDGI